MDESVLGCEVLSLSCQSPLIVDAPTLGLIRPWRLTDHSAGEVGLGVDATKTHEPISPYMPLEETVPKYKCAQTKGIFMHN